MKVSLIILSIYWCSYVTTTFFLCLKVEEDCVGCPLPSTPEDENILDSEMSDVLKAAVLGTGRVG